MTTISRGSIAAPAVFVTIVLIGPAPLRAQASGEGEQPDLEQSSSASRTQIRVVPDGANDTSTSEGPSPWTRRGLSLVGSSLGASFGGGIGLVAGLLISIPFASNAAGTGLQAATLGLSIGMGGGGWIAGSLGAYIIGNEMGGSGDLLASFVGGAAMSAVTYGLALVAVPSSWPTRFVVPFVTGLGVTLLAPVGSVVGYELTHDPAPSGSDEASAGSSSDLQVVPTVVPSLDTSEPAFVGIGGRF